MKFLRAFGMGLVYIVCLPLILVGMALASIYGIGIFFFEFVMMIIHFFSGKKFFPPFEEDAKAQQIRQAQLDAKTTPQAQASSSSQPVYVQNIYYKQPTDGGINLSNEAPTPIEEQPRDELTMLGYEDEEYRDDIGEISSESSFHYDEDNEE